MSDIRTPIFNCKMRIDTVKMYCCISAASIIACVVYALITGKGTAVLDWLVLGTSNDWELADFFRHIGYSSNLRQTYYVSNDACFPPLAYLFFHLLYALNPLPAGIAADNWQAYAMYPYEILLFIFCIVFTGILFYEVIRQFIGQRSLILSLLLLTSAPVFIAVERGNPIFAVTIMMLWALYLREQPENWKRELALILIAVAAGFKIYPAILGLLYIKDKRYSEMWRLLFYGIILFFVPFVFTGGAAGFRQFLNVLFNGHYSADFMKEWSSVRGLCRSIFTKIGLSLAVSESLGLLFENVFLIISIIMALITKERWKTVLILSAAMTFYMPTSWCYNMVFYLLPLLLYFESTLDQKNNINSVSHFYDTVHLLLFTAVFSVPVWGLYGSITKLICLPGYLLWFVIVVEEFGSFIKSVRSKQDE